MAECVSNEKKVVTEKTYILQDVGNTASVNGNTASAVEAGTHKKVCMYVLLKS